MITIEFGEAEELFPYCEEFLNNVVVPDDGPLRLKTFEMFPHLRSVTVMYMEIVCGMVYRSLAQHYMKKKEDEKGEAFFNDVG
jgi:hypothetical protein